MEQSEIDSCAFPFYNHPECNLDYANKPEFEAFYAILTFVARMWFAMTLLYFLGLFFFCPSLSQVDQQSSSSHPRTVFQRWYKEKVHRWLALGLVLIFPLVLDPLGWKGDVMSFKVVQYSYDLTKTLLFGLILFQCHLWNLIACRVSQPDESLRAPSSSPFPTHTRASLAVSNSVLSSLTQKKRWCWLWSSRGGPTTTASSTSRRREGNLFNLQVTDRARDVGAGRSHTASRWHCSWSGRPGFVLPCVILLLAVVLLTFGTLSCTRGPSWLFSSLSSLVFAVFCVGLLVYGWSSVLQLRRMHKKAKPPEVRKSMKKFSHLFWKKHYQREKYVPIMLRYMVAISLLVSCLVVMEVMQASSWVVHRVDMQTRPPKPSRSGYWPQTLCVLLLLLCQTYLTVFYHRGRFEHEADSKSIPNASAQAISNRVRNKQAQGTEKSIPQLDTYFDNITHQDQSHRKYSHHSPKKKFGHTIEMTKRKEEKEDEPVHGETQTPTHLSSPLIDSESTPVPYLQYQVPYDSRLAPYFPQSSPEPFKETLSGLASLHEHGQSLGNSYVLQDSVKSPPSQDSFSDSEFGRLDAQRRGLFVSLSEEATRIDRRRLPTLSEQEPPNENQQEGSYRHFDCDKAEDLGMLAQRVRRWRWQSIPEDAPPLHPLTQAISAMVVENADEHTANIARGTTKDFEDVAGPARVQSPDPSSSRVRRSALQDGDLSYRNSPAMIGKRSLLSSRESASRMLGPGTAEGTPQSNATTLIDSPYIHPSSLSPWISPVPTPDNLTPQTCVSRRGVQGVNSAPSNAPTCAHSSPLTVGEGTISSRSISGLHRTHLDLDHPVAVVTFPSSTAAGPVLAMGRLSALQQQLQQPSGSSRTQQTSIALLRGTTGAEIVSPPHTACRSVSSSPACSMHHEVVQSRRDEELVVSAPKTSVMSDMREHPRKTSHSNSFAGLQSHGLERERSASWSQVCSLDIPVPGTAALSIASSLRYRLSSPETVTEPLHDFGRLPLKLEDSTDSSKARSRSRPSRRASLNPLSPVHFEDPYAVDNKVCYPTWREHHRFSFEKEQSSPKNRRHSAVSLTPNFPDNTLPSAALSTLPRTQGSAVVQLQLDKTPLASPLHSPLATHYKSPRVLFFSSSPEKK